MLRLNYTGSLIIAKCSQTAAFLGSTFTKLTIHGIETVLTFALACLLNINLTAMKQPLIINVT